MKFTGSIGFYMKDYEVKPGVFKNQTIERPYEGDVETDRRYFQADGNQNDSFRVNNRISIIADMFALENWLSISYVKWNGRRIKARSVEVLPPRVKIDLGGEYNG